MVRSPRANIDKQYKGYAMRRSYMLNSKKCHFFEGNDEVHHDVEDLLDLLNMPQEARKEVLGRWLWALGECRHVSDVEKVWLMLPERYLRAFLQDAIVTLGDNITVNEHSLFKRIIQERLDAIVGNYTPHMTHRDQVVRADMREKARNFFAGVYEAMDSFASAGALSPDHLAEWERVKKLFPAGSVSINDRFLFGLIILVAPIWPRSINVKVNPDLMVAYALQTAFIDICSLDGFTNTQKALFIQRGLLNSGLKHKAKHNREDDQPEP